ncbi:MAG TPA: DUF2064 domain-containing protein [Planctomycetota bacterium]|nr:DUF2064 domain-containing protein [Planctomycetota bacterium]
MFVRWPEPGQVLPHLVRRIGAEASAQLYQAFIGDLVAGMPLSTFDGYLYALDNVYAFRDRFKTVQIRAQQGSSEGRRLHGCFHELLATHPRAVIVGSSMPDLHPRLWKSAFEMLDRRDVVVGPTDRGGIYLLGMKKPHEVFRGLKWGTGTELETLLGNLEAAGLNYGFFPTRRKIEQYDDLLPLRRRLLRPMAPLTFATLQVLGIGQETKEVG